MCIIKLQNDPILCVFKDNFWKLTPYFLEKWQFCFQKYPFFSNQGNFSKITLFAQKRGYHLKDNIFKRGLPNTHNKNVKICGVKWWRWVPMIPHFFPILRTQSSKTPQHFSILQTALFPWNLEHACVHTVNDKWPHWGQGTPLVL